MRSMETLQNYNKEALEMEQQLIADITSEGKDKILEKDAVVREVITNEMEDEKYKMELKQKMSELEEYKKELSSKEQDMVIATTKRILEQNPDPNLSFNTVYDQVVAGIQQSRRDKLSKPTFGVLGNTIELEQAKQYGMIAQEDEKEEQAVRQEALQKGYCDEEGLDAFFTEPTDPAGVDRFRSIVRSVIAKRPSPEDITAAEEGDIDAQNKTEAILEGYSRNLLYADVEARKKWTLTPSEKVEAFRLLKEWREIDNLQSEKRNALMETRPVNKIKPLFLYSEDSERTKEWQRDEVGKALRRQLDTDDEVEKSSNELLIKELMEGGNTKERSLCLIDKLIAKATDRVIMDALLDMKSSLLEMEETETEKPTQPSKPLFVDMKQVFSPRDEGEDKKSAVKPLERINTETTPPLSAVLSSEDAEEKETIPTFQPKSEFFSKLDDEEEDDLLEAARPKTDFFTNIDETKLDPNRKATTSNLLGSYEDQLFEQFASKTGAKTEEAKAELKRNLDEINALRSQVYSDVQNEDIARERAAKFNIDVDSLLSDDDNPDVLTELLSKRPVSPKPSDISAPVSNTDTTQHEIVESFGKLKEIKSNRKSADIIGASYRAIAGDDSNVEDEEKFRQFIIQEEELRRKAENETMEELSENVDIDAYADEMLSKMDSRINIIKEAENDDNEEEEAEEEIPLEDIDKEKRKLQSVFDMEDFDPFPVAEKPSWLQREAESEGAEQRGSTSDQELDLERIQEIEERQKMADEYLERAKGGVIDIAEVLDRPYFGSMDEPDYKEKFYGMSSYEGRKDELMEYTT